MNIHRILSSLAFLLSVASLCQTPPGTIPTGTPLAVTIDRNYAMRIGEPIRGHLLYPIYADNRLLLPAGTIITGSVIHLRPDHTRRIHAILGGDFTPFHIPEVSFTSILLSDGTAISFQSGPAATGTQIYRAVSPPPSKGGFFHREYDLGMTLGRSDLAAFIAPGKADRLLQFLYGEIPYHPQRIEKGTSWTVETTAALDLPAQPAPVVQPPPPVRKPHFWEVQPQQAQALPAQNPGTWIVQANLSADLSSETSTNGQAIQATVAQPIYNPDHTLAVPQGAVLTGEVTRAKPARRFGRTGTLNFSFSQLTLPNAEAQTVQTRLVGADSAQDIALSSEGQAKAKPQDKISIPLILSAAAMWSLHQDHDDGGSRIVLKNGTGGADGLGLLGTIVSITAGSANVAGGIGFWGTARAFYTRWIARGQKITFAKDTRIIVETTPRRSAPMTPSPHADDSGLRLPHVQISLVAGSCNIQLLLACCAAQRRSYIFLGIGQLIKRNLQR